MRIALDGCDGTGKTTISEKLANELGYNIVRLTNGGDRSVRAYRELMSCDNVVHDRTFLSEIIYPKYFGRKSRLKKTSIPILTSYLSEFDMQVFILTASNEVIHDRISKRGDEFISDMTMLDNINDEYVKLAKNKKFILIDTSEKTIDEVVREVISYVCR